jgi:hypothetical protein
MRGSDIMSSIERTGVEKGVEEKDINGDDL